MRDTSDRPPSAPDPVRNDDTYTQRGPLSLALSSRRARTTVDRLNDITVDTATDCSVHSAAWFKSHPTLQRLPVSPVPPAVISHRATYGSPIDILGFAAFPITLGNVTRRVEVLVAPSLDPDPLLLDNNCMSKFGDTLNWSNETLSFSTGNQCIPAVHRSPEHALPSSGTQSTVAAVHVEAPQTF